MNGKISVFMISRYATYLLQFIKAISVAAILGPYYFGIWGFITLILQYLSYSNCGLEYSLNVLISTGDKDDPEYASRILSSSFIITAFVGILLLLLGTTAYKFNFFPKYSFGNYVFFIVTIAILQNFKKMLSICIDHMDIFIKSPFLNSFYPQRYCPLFFFIRKRVCCTFFCGLQFPLPFFQFFFSCITLQSH